ncbi:MAG: T9SS type A sorting domain-containing protein, partial [Bacteroidota bacterium]
GPYTGSIRILNNDPLQSVLDVPVDLLVDAGPPEVALDPESLTFDGTLVGASRTLTFEISNAGGNPLIIDSVTSDSEDFIIEDDLEFDVRDDTTEVSVEFAPTAVGTRSGAITLQTNIGEDETVTLPVEGEGLEPPVLALNPEVLQSVQAPDTQEQVELTVSNDGESGSTMEYSFPTFAAQNVLSQPGVEPNNTSSVVNGTRSFDKGDADPHAGQGHPVELGAGGPDNFGYRWIDSNEFGGPSFEWVDISEDGEALDLTDDFVGTPSVEVDLPFDFPFYGETKASVRVDNNGFLFFDSPSGNYFINQEIPNTDDPNGIVAPFWTDLNPDAGGEVYTYHDSENDRFIVQYDEIPPFAFGETEDSFTFQIILTPEGMVRYQYLDMDGNTSLGTVGMEGPAGEDGLQVAFNTSYIENNLAVDIALVPEFITDVDPVAGSIESGESEPVQVTFDSEGLDVGVYGQEGPFGLGVSTNDPQATFGFVPAVLSVVGEDGPEIANAPADQQLTLGGEALTVDINDVFNDPLGEGLDIDIEATNPAVIDTDLSDNTLTVTPTGAGTSRVEIRARNAEGEVQTNFVVTVGQLAVDVNRDFGGQAADATNYRLVALPGSISLSMDDIVDGEAGLDWQAFWDSGEDGIVQFDGSETFTFEPGRGFWLTGQNAWEHQGEYSAIELEQPDGRVAVPLHEGWNIISNPMGTDLEWSDVEALNEGSFQPIWAFNGSFSEEETLSSAMSGEAYYFLNDGGLNELVLQPGEEQPEPPSTTADADPETDPLMSMSATLVDRPELTSTVQLGITESSTTAASIVGPPSDFEAVSLRIQPDADQALDSEEDRPPLMRSQRTLDGEGETFDLTLRTQSEGPVEIRVRDLMASLNGREAALLYPETGTTYDLKTNDVVTLEPASDEVTLRVALGTRAYVDGEVEEVLPTEITLTAYPNPVQSQATVQYTLTEAEDVRFEVYDMLGRRVATLTNERKQAGVHEMQFDANDLASGVYFGRLHVGGETLTQKITVVR